MAHNSSRYKWIESGAQWVIGIGMLSIAVGLSFSHSLISIGVGALALGVIASPTCRQALWQTFSQWRWLYLPLLALYAWQGISWLYTEDTAQWLVEMRIKLPMLFLLPASIVAWQKLSESSRKLIHLGFQVAILVVGLGTLMRFLANPAWGLEEMRHGRYVPMLGGISHIYYSGLVGTALFFLWRLPFWDKRWGRLLIGGLHLIVLHGLALRTGLFAVYGTAAILLILWSFQDKHRWIWGALGIGGLGIVGGLLIRYFPPFQKRWESLKEDLASYKPGGYITYSSVAQRFAALEASWRVFRCSPIWGVGIADNQSAVFAQIPHLPYSWDRKTYILPHNQFVEYAIGLGIIGLGMFLAFWWGAFRERLGWAWTGWLVYWLLLLQVEAFLERQVGVTTFLWGTGLLWAQLKRLKS